MAHKHHTGAVPHDLTPQTALEYLKEGNFRFVNALMRDHDHLEQINLTKDGQWPFAAIVSCMDSRTSAELIFDQGLGDIFSIRNAGNVITNSVLGSLEFATAVAGSKLILVLGHTGCGAIKGACDDVKLGHLTGVLERIKPAVEAENTVHEERNSKNAEFVYKVTDLNVDMGVKRILEGSEVIRALVEKGEVGICPAVYDIATGKVTFHDDKAILEGKAALSYAAMA